jgi:hypothetical protein
MLTIETTFSRFCGKPTKKWYHATSMMVTLVGIKGSRRLYGYSPANAVTLFIRYKGKLYSLTSSFGPVPGDTFVEWFPTRTEEWKPV